MTTINSLSSLSSKTGIGGLVSGMDIDELVLNLTAASRNKIVKQQQKAQKLEWQQTAYRSVTTALKQFQSKYLDVLSQTNFRSASFFNTIKASSSSSATFVSSTPSSVEGTITIDSIEQLATNQTLNSSIAVSKPLSGIISMENIEELAAELSGKTIGIQLDGKLKTITFDADFTDQVMTDPTEANFCNTLQSAIDKAFGIVNVSDQIIYTQVNAGELSFSASGSQLVIHSIGEDTETLSLLGLKDKQSNRLFSTAELKDLSLSTALHTQDTYKFTINAIEFEFNKADSLSTVIDRINSGRAGVTISYSSITDQFTMTSKEQGLGENIVITETHGNLMTAFGLTKQANAQNIYGKNAVLSVNGTKIIRNSNSITIDDVKIDLLSTTETNEEPVIITMRSDSDALIEPIKQFVDDYNSLVDLINGLIKEKVYSDFQPLTDEQKEEMTESQIKKWEEKAKSGILRGDRLLFSLTSKLQSTMCSSPYKNGISLHSIGITSTGYYENGKLQIDEGKLKEALSTNGFEIRELFTSKNGLANQMNEIITGAVKSSGIQGQRGSLVEMAGIASTTSDTENSITETIERTNKIITDLQARLTNEESRLWRRFTAMETALQQLNIQNSIIEQFSSNYSNR